MDKEWSFHSEGYCHCISATSKSTSFNERSGVAAYKLLCNLATDSLMQ